MPILPDMNEATKLAPLSACALAGTKPSFHMACISVSTALTPSPSSGVSSALAGRILAPAATIMGEVTKMLQPGQLPEK